jgi:hypothetical protein
MVAGDFCEMVPPPAPQIKFDPVGYIIFNQEGRLTDRRPLRIGKGANMPGTGRCRAGKRQRQSVSTQSLILHQRPLKLDAIRTIDHKGQRHIERGHALRVAQQASDIGRLTRAIDAALGIDKGIEPFGAGRPDTPRSVKSKAVEVRLRKA